MVDSRYKHGLTLVEILVVVGIIAILVSMAIVVTRRVENQSQENMLANTFAILESALGQFYDCGFRYPSPYEEFRFPLDCDGFGFRALQGTLAEATGATPVLITNHDEEAETNPVKKIEYLEYSGCEVMYFFLSQIPEARQALSGISAALVTNKNMYGRDIQIVVGNRPAEPLLHVVDPWGKPLKYDYYYDGREPDRSVRLRNWLKTRKTFPALVSAGPDKTFGTADDISSKGK